MDKTMLSELPPHLRGDYLTEETKTLVSSLPSHKNSTLTTLYNYQGCWYYPNTLQGVLNFQKFFKPQDTDIILASYPKSGTTWLKALTFAILERSKHQPGHDHPLLSDNPHGIVPFFESVLYSKSTTPDLTQFSSSPRLFSTHMPLHTLQEGLKDSPCKIVYVCRDVKDVLVSLWYYQSAFLEIDLDKSVLESLFESYCSGVHAYGPFWEHVLSYWRGSLENPSHVLFMRYEELKTEPHAQIKRLAEFLDYPFTKEEKASGSVDKILQLCSLSNLSSLEINKNGKTSNQVPHYSYFRKGEIGDSKNHLTLEMENVIDKIIEEKSIGSGMKFRE